MATSIVSKKCTLHNYRAVATMGNQTKLSIRRIFSVKKNNTGVAKKLFNVGALGNIGFLCFYMGLGTCPVPGMF